MSAASSMVQCDPISAFRGRLSTKTLDSARDCGGKRPIAPVCDRICRDFERGVSLRSLGKIYQARVETLEGILRDRLRALEQGMRRAGVVVASVLIVLVAGDAWQEAVSADGAEIVRAFRERRESRRRELESSTAEALEHARSCARTDGAAMAAEA